MSNKKKGTSHLYFYICCTIANASILELTLAVRGIPAVFRRMPREANFAPLKLELHPYRLSSAAFLTGIINQLINTRYKCTSIPMYYWHIHFYLSSL